MTTTRKNESNSRADTEIMRDVLRRMKADLQVPDDHIQVTAVDGVVTLFGTVAHDEQKRAAEACVSGVDGVRGVDNLIAVDASRAATEA